MRATSRLMTAGALALVTAASAAGCGGNSAKGGVAGSTPQARFQNAMTALGHGSALTMTFKIDVTAAQAAAIDQATGSKSSPTTDQLISTASLTVSEKLTNGKSLDAQPVDASALQVDVAINVGGGPVVEIRYLGGTLYARLGTTEIAQIAGPKGAQTLSGLSAQIPPTLTWAHAALQGQWVSITLAQIKSLEAQLPGAKATPNAAQQQSFLAGLRAILARDVTVADSGTASDGSDHLVLSGNVRTLATDLEAAIGSLVPSASSALSKANPQRLPDKVLNIDAYVSNGIVSKMVFNAAQTLSATDQAKLHGQGIPIEVDFSQSAAAVQAPSATPIDLSQIFSLLGNLGRSSSSQPSSSSG
ncbi:MAG TPA: hypothetical protein VNG13_13990 [Mycobacteriales bacterium]|nr:hypothetical protein [Mycobacteriales bacterium]